MGRASFYNPGQFSSIILNSFACEIATVIEIVEFVLVAAESTRKWRHTVKI